MPNMSHRFASAWAWECTGAAEIGKNALHHKCVRERRNAGARERGSVGAWELRERKAASCVKIFYSFVTRSHKVESDAQQLPKSCRQDYQVSSLRSTVCFMDHANQCNPKALAISLVFDTCLLGVQVKRSSEEMLMMLRVPSITHDASYNQMTQQFAVRKLAFFCMEAGTMIGSILDFFSLLYQIKFQTPKAEWMVEGGMGVRKCCQKLECDICSCCYWSKTPGNAMHNVKSTGIIMYCWPTQCLCLYNGHWLQWLTLSPQILAGINGIKI